MTGADETEFFEQMNHRGIITVPDPPKLDLEIYISNYTGRTRFDRLMLIGQSSPSLHIDALKYAVAEAKKGKDTARYKEACSDLNSALKDLARKEPGATQETKWDVDQGWVDSQTKANHNETARLEAELKGYKNNLVKESIRIGHRDLGEHLEALGDLNGASDIYIKMRPDASTVAHIINVGWHIIRVLLQKRDWPSVQANVSKLLVSSSDSEQTKAFQPFAKMVSGLAYLGSEKYYEAARCFLDVGDPAICQNHTDVMSVNDVATYGGLLALASMNRQELQGRVLDSSTFRNFLELEPHIRKAVSMFVNGRYSACLAVLNSYRADYTLDIYLQKHVQTLYEQIRSKCIVQYFTPFSCVTLDSLNASFAKPGESLVPELITMIKNGALNARINTIDKLLVAVSSDPRVSMQNEVLEMAKRYESENLERIRRMSLAAADIEVKGSSRGKALIPESGASNSQWADDMLRGPGLPTDENVRP